jgi:hypothetical protein
MSLRKFLGNARRNLLRRLFGEELFAPISAIKELNYKIAKYMPESKYAEYLSDWLYDLRGRRVDLEHPRTYHEKCQWMKLHDSTPIKTRLADKYLVREWVVEKIGAEYLFPLLGVWDRFDDIDFDTLPGRFVLKANHNSGGNIIVKDKSRLNKKLARRKFEYWQSKNQAYMNALELHYRDIPMKIIAEQYMEDESGQLRDYKILCFNGEPAYIWVDIDRFTNHRRNVYNLRWELQPFMISYPPKGDLPKPKKLDEMIRLAKILSAGFYHVRVDFYYVNEKIYVGEMTFISESGSSKFEPEEWNLRLGDMIRLPCDTAGQQTPD